ncbi:hypothetical protein Tco_0494353 [Tanacetum coccineum]
MPSTRASISKSSNSPKINIIPPKQLFVDLTQDDTKTPSPKLQLSSPSAPNAPSKSKHHINQKNTSSSSIDYIPKSPTSSTSLSPNGYLNPPTSPPPRVSPPPPTQENASIDITLTLSPITPLDVAFGYYHHFPNLSGHRHYVWNLQITWRFITASATPEVSTAAESLVYIRSAKKKKDKGKEIVIEDESVQKKYKKQVQEEKLEYDKAGKKEVVTEVDIAHVIDWNDPSVIRLKRAGQDVEAEPAKRQRTEEVSDSVQEQTDEDPKTDKLSQE